MAPSSTIRSRNPVLLAAGDDIYPNTPTFSFVGSSFDPGVLRGQTVPSIAQSLADPESTTGVINPARWSTLIGALSLWCTAVHLIVGSLFLMSIGTSTTDVAEAVA